MAQKPETLFKNRIRPLLTGLPKCYVEKIQQVAIHGTPDFLMCVNGSFVALELKRDAKAPVDALQIYNLRIIRSAGGIGLLVWPEIWLQVYGLLRSLAKGEPNAQTELRAIAESQLHCCRQKAG
jgi:hypothetical protein